MLAGINRTPSRIFPHSPQPAKLTPRRSAVRRNRDRYQKTFLHFVRNAAPGNRTGKESGNPDKEVDGVTKRGEPPTPARDRVIQTPNTRKPDLAQTENEVGQKVPRGAARRGSKSGTQDGPRQAKSQKKADVAGGSDVAQANGPTQLVTKEITKRFVGKNHFHRRGKQLDFQAAGGDAIAKLEIVGVVVDHGLEAADGSKMGFCRGHGPTERELHFAFDLASHQSIGNSFRGKDQGFEFRSEAACGYAAEERGDGADGGIREARGDPAKIARGRANVTITDDQQVIAGFAGEARETVEFAISAKLLDARDQADGNLGEILLQLPNHGNDRVVRVGDGEENFVPRVVLPAETSEVFVGAAIDPTDGFENADRRGEGGIGGRGLADFAEVVPGAVDGEEIIRKGCKGQNKNNPAKCR